MLGIVFLCTMSISHNRFSLTVCATLQLSLLNWFPAACRDLSWSGLAGSIPAGGWNLPETLDILILQGNGLNGTLPSTFNLPADLGTLDLSSNSLSGQLSWDWRKPGRNSSLAYLLLRGNELSGSLPANLTLSGMVILDLAENHLTGVHSSHPVCLCS